MLACGRGVLRTMSRAGGAVACAALVAAGCAGHGTARLSTSGAPAPVAPAATPAPAWRTVTYGKARFDVPTSWPVYDLSTDAGRCVRFDQHAVYLGHQGPAASCPAHLLGRTETAQVEPLDARSQANLLPGAQTTTINGLPAAIQPFGQASNNTVASFATVGVVVTVTWSTDQGLAQHVLSTVRGA
jgi:hypothetical protein